ncbi:flagellar hook assembly protein FlgD [Puerhibacterium puerhi]|uniref:flagellar hook assembly protein FlgD n=1 Tax=Puerhibacterium puerhi TaxID=2692623 RepID=UPI0019156DB9|nr:flagellar hook capping FlgD N-terminal domain-containing protein [Puerhibacterium puerhi]
MTIDGSIPVSAIGAGRTAATAATGATASGGTTAKDGSTLDSEAFLQLLVAQLRYQDPTSPMDTTQLMAQTTQMTSVEQLVALADTQREAFAMQQRATAASLVGKQITAVDAEGTKVTGVVSAVSYESGTPLLQVGDVLVPLDLVTVVAPVGSTPPATGTPGTGTPGTGTPATGTPVTDTPDAGTPDADTSTDTPADAAGAV